MERIAFEYGSISNAITQIDPNHMNSAESILNALAEPVLVLDGDLRLVVANAAFYDTMMISPELTHGKAVEEVLVEGGAALNLKTVLESVATRNSDLEHLEIECALPDADRKILSLTARLVTIGDNPTEMVLVELQDITRQEEAEGKILALNAALQHHAAELEIVNRDLEAFTHSASHDLRSPLRFMDKIANMLLQDHGPELPAGAVEKIKMIMNSAVEMGRLIEELITFSQVRHHPIQKTQVGMLRLAHEALGELNFETEGLDELVTVDELPPCRGERALLKQVFLNLLTNALKFSRSCADPRIHVGFTELKGVTAYFVRDNGVGIPEKHMDAIFQPFQRFHRDQGFEGSGLGLAIVKRIVESHNGRVWPESPLGKGTTMYFTLNETRTETLTAADGKNRV